MKQTCHLATTMSMTGYEGKKTSKPFGMILDKLTTVLPRLSWYSAVDRNLYDELSFFPSGPCGMIPTNTW